MITYAIVKETTLITYPYMFSTLQEQNPHTNFGDNYDVAYWFPQTQTAIENSYTIEPVTISPKPHYDPNNEICVQDANPKLNEEGWSLGWTVSEMNLEQKEEYENNVKFQNKNKAMKLLSDTDWTSIPSVGDASQSNPYLVNQAAFLSYRSEIRFIAVNPPSTPVTSWPTTPKEQWSF